MNKGTIVQNVHDNFQLKTITSCVSLKFTMDPTCSVYTEVNEHGRVHDVLVHELTEAYPIQERLYEDEIYGNTLFHRGKNGIIMEEAIVGFLTSHTPTRFLKHQIFEWLAEIGCVNITDSYKQFNKAMHTLSIHKYIVSCGPSYPLMHWMSEALRDDPYDETTTSTTTNE
jgi:hypothetical protein